MLLSTQNVSAVSSVDFTSIINSAYANYQVVFDSVVSTGSSTDAYAMVQLSDDNGVTYQTTSYINYLGGFSTTGMTIGLIFDGGMGVGYEASGYVNLHNLFSSLLVTNEGQSTIYDSLTPSMAGQTSNGVYTAPLVVDAIRIVSSDGNPISGNFYLYGF